MTIFSTLLHKIIPYTFKDSINIRLDRSYNRFRLTLFAVMLGIAIIPALIIAGLGYHNYKDLLHKEESEQLESRLDGSIKSIEALVNNLKSIVLLAARNDRFSELITGDNLENLFLRMKDQHVFFADLGVIDHRGIQQAYCGPYDLKGDDYSAEPWLKEVGTQGLYISSVHTGHREVPHFDIAVSRSDPKTLQKWVLRATIEAASLQQFINTIKTNGSDDLFLVDDQGYLQTSSDIYGKLFSQLGSDIPLGAKRILAQEGKTILFGVDKISNSPWSLVLVEKQYIHQQDWITFQKKLLTIVLTCLVFNLLVVYGLVTMLTNLIHKADQMQLTMLREAEHTDKLVSIGRLAAGVGHEINNPLAIINQKTGLVEDLLLISPDFEHKATIDGCLKGINHSVNRCKAITHRLLGFARRAEVHTENLQINETIKEVLQFLDNSMVHNRIQLDLQLEEDLQLLVSDPLQLQQVFLNIINNGIDAAGKDGRISIQTQSITDGVQVTIADDGHGISKDILPHIFEPFFTTKETGKGTGLGLSITYGLVKKLGGDITVQSDLGQGTTFKITLPLEREKK